MIEEIIDTPLVDEAVLDEARNLIKAKFPLVVSYYLEDMERYIADVGEGIRANDLPRIVGAAHTVKSSSHQLGAMRMALLGKHIEAMARTMQEQNAGSASFDRLGSLQAHLVSLFGETRAALQPYSAA